MNRINNRNIWVCLLLVAATLAVYWQVQNFEFVNFDDNTYVYDNSHVQNGLTFENITWAFTATHASNWHPLTWLSHMLDCQLYGMNSGQHHLTNLLFHIANTLLLFFVLTKMTAYRQHLIIVFRFNQNDRQLMAQCFCRGFVCSSSAAC
ncbi:MAG: hypothetical protein JRJ46_06725 [Deltaproteobacteria bacterium]|nr:hypothetical protein [Deltaproteobacteria bacterium]